MSPRQSAQVNINGYRTTYTFEHYDPHLPGVSSQKGKQVGSARSPKAVQNPGQPDPSSRRDQRLPDPVSNKPEPSVDTESHTPSPRAPQMGRTGPAVAGSVGFDGQEILQSATVETLLKSGFIPPFVSIGEDMPREEQEAMFRALSLEDKKCVLESFLAEKYNDRDAAPQHSPRSISSPSTPIVQDKSNDLSQSAQERPEQGQADGTHFGVVLLNAFHDMGQSVERRLDNMEQSIEGLDAKVSTLQSEHGQFTHSTSSQKHPSLSRANARRMAALNAASEDFSEQLRAVASDNERQPAGSHTTACKDPDLNPKDPHMRALLKCVRLHCDRDLLQIRSAKDLFTKWPPMSDDDLEARGLITSCANFCIDFIRGWKTSPLNTHARDFFGDDFLATYRGGQFDHHNIPAQYFNRELILELLDSHMGTLRAEYANARRGDKTKDERVRQRKNANTRQSTTLEQRWNTVTNPVHGIQRHAVLLNKLRPPHVEPDEPAGFRIDEDGKKHRIFNMIRPAWQSDLFWKFMKDLDGLKGQADEDAIGASRKPGALARDRVELAQPKIVETTAPKGLWKNCYDEEWLAKLKLPSRRTLNVMEENYDFSLDYRVEEGL